MNLNKNDTLINRTKKRCVLLLGFIILFAWFGIRLATVESPEEWKNADIKVADVQRFSRKPYRWRITDTEGNTYSISEAHIAINQILPQSIYHIVYSPSYNNGIRAITHGDTIIVDYAHSISVHSERDIWDWLLAFLGLTGALTTIAYTVIDIRKKTNHG